MKPEIIESEGKQYEVFARSTKPNRRNFIQEAFNFIRQKLDPNYADPNDVAAFASQWGGNTNPSPIAQARGIVNTMQPQVAPSPSPNVQAGFRIQDPRVPNNIPNNINQILGEHFDPINEATNSARVLQGENGGYRANAVNNNRDGSVDTGLFQINSNTFNDFMRRKGYLLRQAGINNYQDMFDLNKNAIMARIIFDEQGWGAWYGAPTDLRNQ